MGKLVKRDVMRFSLTDRGILIGLKSVIENIVEKRCQSVLKRVDSRSPRYSGVTEIARNIVEM